MVLFKDFVSGVCQKSPYQLPTSYEPLPDFSIICDVSVTSTVTCGLEPTTSERNIGKVSEASRNMFG